MTAGSLGPDAVEARPHLLGAGAPAALGPRRRLAGGIALAATRIAEASALRDPWARLARPDRLA